MTSIGRLEKNQAAPVAMTREGPMKKLTLMILVLGLCTLAVSPASAFYIGAGIGNTFFSSDYNDALDQIKKIDENSTSWKIFGGWSGHKFLGIEGGWRDFGDIETTADGEKWELGTSGFDIEATGRITIAIVDIFGKAGVMFWNSDFKIDGTDVPDDLFDGSGTDFLWGLGAGVHLGAIGVRVEWESLEVSGPDNLSMVSLSATLGF